MFKRSTFSQPSLTATRACEIVLCKCSLCFFVVATHERRYRTPLKDDFEDLHSALLADGFQFAIGIDGMLHYRK
jgi:hypothetical protein